MKNLLKKLHRIQGLNLTFQKTEENPFFHSKYLPLEELQKKLNPILDSNNLVVYHYTENKEVKTVVADVDSAETLTSSFPIQDGLDPQKCGSTITYGKRYNLGQIFNIITDEDDDANAYTSASEAFRRTFEPKTMKDTTNAVQAPINAKDSRLMWCSVCRVDAKVSQRTGKPYCPNFKKHPQGTYVPLEPKPSEKEIQFADSLEPSQEELDEINAQL